jgi:glycosyltransferase involved in cell wall biosynthesis
MRRICLVTETFPPEVNGVAMTLQRLCREWVRRGIAVEVVRPRQAADAGTPEPRPWAELLVGGFPIPKYPEARIGAWAAGRLKRAWTARRPDWVHIATEGMLGWSARQAARALGIPLVTSFHTNFHDYARHYGVGPLRPLVVGYLRAFHNGGSLCLVPDEGLRRELEALGFQRTGRMGRGVDVALFDPARRDPTLRQAWGVGPEDPVIVHVSRAAAEKNIPLVVRAWRAVRSRQPRAKLVLVGGGPEEAALRRLCPEAVHAGMRYDADLARHYASGDFFFFASETETYGNVVIEAMASGLAVLAYDYAAAGQHIRSGVNGFTVAKGDADAFIRQALRMTAEGADRDVRELRAAARATTLRLPWSGVVDSYLAEVASVLESHSVREATASSSAA